MHKRAFAVCAAAALVGAAPMRTADPMAFMQFLHGTWNCSSTAGGKTTAYTVTYASALGGRWMRAVNRARGSESEDMLTYAHHRWLTVDMEADGSTTVLTAPDTGAAHIVYRRTYPGSGLRLTFDRLSFTKYTLTFRGTIAGAPANWTDVCTKAPTRS